MRHYLLDLLYALENTLISKCKIQMRHYGMVLFYG